MKVEMSEFGTLVITAETSVEAYAIARWGQESWVAQQDATRCEGGHWRGSRLMIQGLPAKGADDAQS